MELTPDQKGGTAELAIAARANLLAIGVSRPVVEGLRYGLIPIAKVTQQRALHLRLSPAKNNQRSRVIMADSFRLGAVAQLGERRAGSAKARGSSPLSSIAREPSERAALVVPGP